VAVAAHLDGQPLREGIDHTDTHSVKTARDLVALAAELAAGVQLGHDDLERRPPVLRHVLHRYAAAVVGDAHRGVGAYGHVDGRTHTRQGFIDRVVDHFVDQVM